jgi:hypothetical protein
MLKRNVVVLTILAVVLGAGAYAWAQAEPERPTTTADTPNARRVRPDGALKERLARRRAHRRAGPRRAIHGDLIVRGKDGFQNVTFDKGEVTAHSDTSITVKRADGVEVTKAVNGETKFKGIASAGEITDGDPALVISKGDAASVVAQRSGDPPERPR